MAERRMNGFQRILGVTLGLAVAEADVGQFPLHQVDQARVLRGKLLRRRRCGTAGVCELDDAGVLALEMAQHVLQRVLDPSEIVRAVVGR
jgi:hypothetical protein